ncbi:hypothetical protein ACHAPT_009909 [Fusarium lateritium]
MASFGRRGPEKEPSSAAASDGRHVKSPYVGNMLGVAFGRNHMWVHERAIREHPKFAAQFRDGYIYAHHIPEEAAHIVVHYLYNRSYQALQPTGPTGIERTISEFRMAVHACDIAAQFTLPDLENSANQELGALGPMLKLNTIVVLLGHREFEETTANWWLCDHLEGRARDGWESVDEDAVKRIPLRMNDNRLLSDVLCRTIKKMRLGERRVHWDV